ncbi:UDP-3-O-3-hydroxymyristoyl N-acetylglucosaminedeacetylase/(3R)-hydroxymyristoyl-(acyl-carrier-protein) [Parvularcula bermudensis HTCC2503]|uniref:3-hydroxyacyl-[acyl-carrier-protein] dehydratase FabZ n=1 Tax=Parvularcula bermudensis (strain ATCC BAA-594 / HTCC2503 / KCTC 12087) TaxID=314260 RepID=E0TCD1_PARBH|nr:3-hydroxyacyl-ACP dehydratase FabZ [Parvularcula bermudensis]ADM08564.1 UDP-3-O-3-hydroxymyristoyl N-acetylglucosaminedeacetylase/(3R)-hydroxymyristoyl-(acyl-carrier-protein) [Parvularcula bermudensis HTCC2503]
MTESQDTPRTFPDLDVNGIKAILPHRYPMLMIDKIVDITLDGATGVKSVTANEPFFEGHFPQMPVMPGVLIIEAMAQTAAAYTAYVEEIDTEGKVVLFMGIEKAKFRHPVFPGEQLRIETKIASKRPPVWRYEAKAYVNGKLATEASFGAMLTEPK